MSPQQQQKQQLGPQLQQQGQHVWQQQEAAMQQRQMQPGPQLQQQQVQQQQVMYFVPLVLPGQAAPLWRR